MFIVTDLVFLTICLTYWFIFACFLSSSFFQNQLSSENYFRIAIRVPISHRVGDNQKRSDQSTDADQKSLETVFLIAICRPSGDIWQSKTLFLAIFDLRPSIWIQNIWQKVVLCNILTQVC